MTDHKEWLETRTGKTIHAIALDLGEDPSNFSKKVKRGLTTDHIIEISRHYEIPVISALRETGVIKPEDETEPEDTDRIVSTIHYLADKLAVKAKQNKQESNTTTDNVHHLPYTQATTDHGIDYDELGAVAYPHDEIGGTPDDLDP